MKCLALLICVSAVAIASMAQAQTKSEDVKVPGGSIKVSITPIGVASAAKGPKNSPRMGVSESGILPTPLARKLDETAKVQVISPAKFSSGDAKGSFDTLTRSEFADALTAGCRQSKVDYALYSAQPEMTSGLSPTALIFGFGRSRATKSFELRIYDCRSHEIVWDEKVDVESSAGLWTNMMTGKVTGGGGESESAAAQVIAARIVSDMDFGGGSAGAESTVQVAASSHPERTQSTAVSNIHAVLMVQPGHLYSAASAKSKIRASLPADAILYPTGQTSGIWQEVDDEEGNRGWVSSRLLSPYKH